MFFILQFHRETLTVTQFYTKTAIVTQTVTERVRNHKIIHHTVHARPTECVTSTKPPLARTSYVDYYGDQPLPPVVQPNKSFQGMYLNWLKSRMEKSGFYIDQYGTPHHSDDLSKEMGRRWPRNFVIDEQLWWA